MYNQPSYSLVAEVSCLLLKHIRQVEPQLFATGFDEVTDKYLI